MSKATIDRLLESWVSKKLAVFMISSAYVGLGWITGTDWVNIALMYIGTQGAIDAIIRLRGQ